MNNNNFNHNNKANDQSSMKSQQFFPGRGPMPPQPPSMEGQPRTAPPSFIPEAPGMERRPMGGRPGMERRPMDEPFGYGPPRRDEEQNKVRELRRCLNRFTFIWLVNGNSFWFYPTFIDRQFVQGFRWRRDRWEFDRINIRRILFSRCF